MRNFKRQPAAAPVDRTGQISQPAQIRALESPTRQELIDAIAALGPCSMSDLASYLGRQADSLYFHVRKLVRVGLVTESREKQGRHVFARYSVPTRQPRIQYSPALARSIQRVVAGAVRLSLREFKASFGDPAIAHSGPDRDIWGGRFKGWLSRDEVVELNTHLDAIAELMRRSGPGPERRVHSFAWLSTPVRVKSRSSNTNKEQT